MIKYTKILYTSLEDDVFLDRVLPTPEQRAVLVEAKNAIRDHLRPRIRDVTVKLLGMERAVSPRFRTQGSWAYKTCVQPAHPSQEMDWDFGVYLPVTVWEEAGPPSAMARAYFDLVESLLRDLCHARSWRLDTGKATCIRVHVTRGAHIDVPLYAAPEKAFNTILEKASHGGRVLHAARDSEFLGESKDAGELAEVAWADLEHIVMAVRSGEWKPSDPEVVAKWFNDRMEQHGEQLRRVCRYLKAWRDHVWTSSGGPSSVALMIAASQSFVPIWGRDDLAVEAGAKALLTALKGELREPAIDGGKEDFLARMSSAERAAAVGAVSALIARLEQVRQGSASTSMSAIATLRVVFGLRIPDRSDLLEGDDGVVAVRSTPARRVPAPVVPATSAG